MQGKDYEESEQDEPSREERLAEWASGYDFRSEGRVAGKHLYKAGGGVTETDISRLREHFDTDPHSPANVEAEVRLPGERRYNTVEIQVYSGRKGIHVFSDRPISDLLSGEEEETDFQLLEPPGNRKGSPT